MDEFRTEMNFELWTVNVLINKCFLYRIVNELFSLPVVGYVIALMFCGYVIELMFCDSDLFRFTMYFSVCNSGNISSDDDYCNVESKSFM